MGKIIPLEVSADFHFFLYYPEGILADFISMIWASDGLPPFSRERIVPDGANVLVFNFGSPIALGSNAFFKKTLFAGVNSTYNTLHYEPGHAQHTQAGIIFKPGGAYPFIQQPIIDFKNLVVETSALGDGYFEAVHEQIGEMRDPKNRIARLTQLLSDRLKKNFEDKLTPQLIHLIRRHPEKSIEEITQKTGYSQQHLNRLLGKFAGMNAKGFQKIFRLQQAMQAVQKMGDAENLTAIAYDLGYFDQAHFIHDFKEMTGMTPKAYQLIQQPDSNRIIYL